MNLFDRAKNILVNPQKEWDIISSEEQTISSLYKNYALILAAISSVAGFIGFSFFGFSYGFGTITLPLTTNLIWALVSYILSLAGVYVIALIIDALAPTFGSTKNIVASTKVIVFSYTASWVGGIFNIIPALSLLGALAGIYSLVLLYWGLEKVKAVPKEKMIGYFVTIIITVIVIYVITGWIITSILFSGSTIPVPIY